MKKMQVIVIGGGASGMMAAITAAKKGAAVILLEHTERVGKKILSTGNGKCNLSNVSVKVEDYRGSHPQFVEAPLAQFGMKDTVRFFEALGMLIKEKNGCLYPNSEQAASVLDILRFTLQDLHIEVKTDIHVKRIEKKEQFVIVTNKCKYTADTLILACGGMAAPQTGSDGSGYELARQLGHTIVTPLPALTALKSPLEYFKALAGIRCECHVRLFVDRAFVGEDTGELQITNYGISGIPVFQISRMAAKALNEKKLVYAMLDFIPQFTLEEWKSELLKRRENLAAKTAETFLLGVFNKKLIYFFLKQADVLPTSMISNISDTKLKILADITKKLIVPIHGTNSFEQAQVCAGGISTEELQETTMQSKLVKGLYFAGEIIDIDGKCGGYNLQWAWTSGYIAGKNSAKSNR